MNKESKMRELVRVLVNLSNEENKQEAYLKAIGTFPSLDELGLEFDDIYLAVCEENTIGLTNNQKRSLKEVNEALLKISGDLHKEEWMSVSLGNASWAQIRLLAKEALGLFVSVE